MLCYCYRSGEIRFGEVLPKGALVITRGTKDELEKRVLAKTRRAYDNETLLVPGVPEAQTSDEALSALMKFIEWVDPEMAEKRVAAEERAGRSRP